MKLFRSLLITAGLLAGITAIAQTAVTTTSAAPAKATDKTIQASDGMTANPTIAAPSFDSMSIMAFDKDTLLPAIQLTELANTGATHLVVAFSKEKMTLKESLAAINQKFVGKEVSYKELSLPEQTAFLAKNDKLIAERLKQLGDKASTWSKTVVVRETAKQLASIEAAKPESSSGNGGGSGGGR